MSDINSALNSLRKDADERSFFENEAFFAWLVRQDMSACREVKVITYTTGGLNNNPSYTQTARDTIHKLAQADAFRLIFCKNHRGLVTLLSRYERCSWRRHERVHTKLYLFNWKGARLHEAFVGSLNLGTTAYHRNLLYRTDKPEDTRYLNDYFERLWTEANRMSWK